jgi:hypothetical protein
VTAALELDRYRVELHRRQAARAAQLGEVEVRLHVEDGAEPPAVLVSVRDVHRPDRLRDGGIDADPQAVERRARAEVDRDRIDAHQKKPAGTVGRFTVFADPTGAVLAAILLTHP